MTADAHAVGNHLLDTLPLEDLARLRPSLEHVEFPFAATVHRPGDRLDAAFFPNEGMVSMVGTLEDGTQMEVGTVGREGLVGLPLVLGTDRGLVEAIAQTDVVALRISAAALCEAVDRSATLRSLLLRYAMAFQVQVTQTALCNGRHAVDQRLARWLLIAHDLAVSDEFTMTHEFIAMMLGVRRPGVSVVAAMLQKAGLISYARGRMTVLDRPGLEAAACECYFTVRDEFRQLLGEPAGG